MKPKKIFINLVIALPVLFVFDGCYTQLASSRVIVVESKTIYHEPSEPQIQEERMADTLTQGDSQTTSVVHEYNYRFADPSAYWFGYDPWFDSPRYYLRINYRWGYSSWDPWYSPRYYNYGYGPYYAGYCGYDPYWWDPYYSYGYYSGYHYGYRYSYWDWYNPRYYGRSPDHEKRNWERRGADLTETVINRPPPSGGSQINSLAHESGNVVVPIKRTDSKTCSIRRNESGSGRTIQRTETDSNVRETRNTTRSEESRVSNTSHQPERRNERSVSRSNDNNKRDNNRSVKPRRQSSKSRSNSILSRVITETVKTVSNNSRSNKKKQSKSARPGRKSSARSQSVSSGRYPR